MYAEDDHAGPGRVDMLFEQVALGKQAPVLWNRAVADWLDVICTLKIEVLGMRGNLLPSPTDIVPIREKNPPEPHNLPFLTENSLQSYRDAVVYGVIDQNVIMWCMTVL